MAEKQCNDENCWRHGSIKTRGFTTEGKVVSDKGKLTVIVEKNLIQTVPKYKRWARRTSRIPAHNPICINAKVGDTVRIGECRRISKSKSWVVTEVLKRGE